MRTEKKKKKYQRKMSGVTQQEEEKKPAGDQGGHINLKVKSQVFFCFLNFFIWLQLYMMLIVLVFDQVISLIVFFFCFMDCDVCIRFENCVR